MPASRTSCVHAAYSARGKGSSDACVTSELGSSACGWLWCAGLRASASLALCREEVADRVDGDCDCDTEGCAEGAGEPVRDRERETDLDTDRDTDRDRDREDARRCRRERERDRDRDRLGERRDGLRRRDCWRWRCCASESSGALVLHARSSSSPVTSNWCSITMRSSRWLATSACRAIWIETRSARVALRERLWFTTARRGGND